MKKIYFVHDGKANYPSIKGYKELWRGMFAMEEVTFKDALEKPDIGESICWHMMGFYHTKLPCAYTIHDYRSLSVGRGRKIKDFIKCKLNAVPDLRVIQPSIENQLIFNDKVPVVLQDVGVSDAVLEYVAENKQNNKDYDFCYIGAMKSERKMEIMIDSFIKNYQDRKSLILVGKPETYLIERYKEYNNIIFTGLQDQSKVFDYLKRSSVSVCYFPLHYPHCVQTPTKLLEAAILKCRILANRQPMNIKKAEEYGISVQWCDTGDMFSNLPENLDWDDNSQVNPNPMLWSTIVEQSKILDYLS